MSSVEQVTEAFHARYLVVEKTYQCKVDIGKPPVDFEALFDVARLRFKARKLGITEIIG